MFGDDPDPSVVTVRFVFGEVFERAQGEVCALCREVMRPDKREANSVGLGTVNDSKGDAATMSGCKF